MAVLTDQQATLTQTASQLYSGALAARVTITGVAGEFSAVPLEAKPRLRFVFGGRKDWFDGMEAAVGLLGGTIFAKAPAGVGSLDIVYELRTGSDARRSHFSP